MGYFRILAAIPGFFLSSFLFMLLWDVIAPKLGIVDINYVTAMLITITLWIAVAPLAAVGKKEISLKTPSPFYFGQLLPANKLVALSKIYLFISESIIR